MLLCRYLFVLVSTCFGVFFTFLSFLFFYFAFMQKQAAWRFSFLLLL